MCDIAFALGYGTKVEGSAAALPQTSTGSLFTVSGGRVIVTVLVGQVASDLGGAVDNCRLHTAPTTGPSVYLNGNASIGQDVGSMYGSAATAWVVPAGTIDLTTGGNSSGTLSWVLAYVPLDNGASVAAA